MTAQKITEITGTAMPLNGSRTGKIVSTDENKNVSSFQGDITPLDIERIMLAENWDKLENDEIIRLEKLEEQESFTEAVMTINRRELVDDGTPEAVLKEECEIILMVKMPDGSVQEQYLWTAAKGETLKLNPVRP